MPYGAPTSLRSELSLRNVFLPHFLCLLIVKLLEGHVDTISFAFLMSLLCPVQGDSWLLNKNIDQCGVWDHWEFHPWKGNVTSFNYVGKEFSINAMELERKLQVSEVFALEFYFLTGRRFGVCNIPIPTWVSIGTCNPLANSTGGFVHL